MRGKSRSVRATTVSSPSALAQSTLALLTKMAISSAGVRTNMANPHHPRSAISSSLALATTTPAHSARMAHRSAGAASSPLQRTRRRRLLLQRRHPFPAMLPNRPRHLHRHIRPRQPRRPRLLLVRAIWALVRTLFRWGNSIVPTHLQGFPLGKCA